MPSIFWEEVGAVLGMVMFSALFAWIYRKVLKVGRKWSYLMGTLTMVAIAPIIYHAGEQDQPFLHAFIMYAVAGAVAYPVLLMTSPKQPMKVEQRMKRSAQPPAIWYVSFGDKEAGPFSQSVVEGYLESGDLTLDDECWRRGFDQWMPLRQTVEFAS